MGDLKTTETYRDTLTIPNPPKPARCTCLPMNHASNLQDWKLNKHAMGSVRAYDPNPPKNDAEVDISKFEFKHVQCTVQPNGTGWSRYKIVLPASVRQLYANDVVYGPEWRELLSDFDRRPSNSKLCC